MYCAAPSSVIYAVTPSSRTYPAGPTTAAPSFSGSISIKPRSPKCLNALKNDATNKAVTDTYRLRGGLKLSSHLLFSAMSSSRAFCLRARAASRTVNFLEFYLDIPFPCLQPLLPGIEGRTHHDCTFLSLLRLFFAFLSSG